MNGLILSGLLVLPAIFWMGCSSTAPLDTVEKIDLQSYMGRWYEIASFPNRFQKGCQCTTAEYELSENGYVKVINKCRKDSITGKLSEANGKAFVVNGSNNTKLKVQFFWPFRGDYYIIDIAPDYNYAVVGNPSRKYLWILSRTPVMDDSLYKSLADRAKGKGFDITKLVKTNQDCGHISQGGR
jgi:apolipoprotein D and lipocalin family protein